MISDTGEPKPSRSRQLRPRPNLDDFRAFYEIPDRIYFGFHLALASRFFDKLVGTAIQQESATTLSHWRVLSQLYVRNDMTVRLLAEHVAVDRAEISRAIRELEETGHVSRQSNSSDRRSPLLSLTTSGRALTERLRTRVRIILESLIDGVPSEDLDAAERVLQTFTMRAFVQLHDASNAEEF